MNKLPKSIEIIDGKVFVVDQTKLPTSMNIIEIKTCDSMVDAIIRLVVRGAPLIGCSASAGLYLAAKEIKEDDNYYKNLMKKRSDLVNSRPTAVNLVWALERLDTKINNKMNKENIINILYKETINIINEDTKLCKSIGIFGQEFFEDGDTILTHCNAGSLATSYYGTALSPIYVGTEKGKTFKVYSDETRPLLQGSRITAWELKQSNIDVVVIADNMAGWLMKQGKINKIIIGADRIAANGDSANKIGSYSLSMLAKVHNIPFFVAAPYSTIDMKIKTGDDIEIEERNPIELIKYRDCQTAPSDINVYNPAFDVVPNENITAIITDRGVIEPDFIKNINIIMH